MQDRATPRKDETPSRSMGMTEDEGGTSSVNQKDDFWKTQEGYDKAIEMYGSKPTWVKEPTLIWNPSEQEYEEIEEEDEEHEFFYTSSLDCTFCSLVIDKTDEDGNGNPVGLETSLFFDTPATDGSITVVLKHEPSKPNDGTSADAGGSTDVEVSFNITVL